MGQNNIMGKICLSYAPLLSRGRICPKAKFLISTNFQNLIIVSFELAATDDVQHQD